mmetsp:Transcript_72850/g.213705  ORF Transcript_72850/g.213705 Transcript_72850/m.213705 type:complete len:259 (+) Transcript_72850:295-1071(+)
MCPVPRTTTWMFHVLMRSSVTSFGDPMMTSSTHLQAQTFSTRSFSVITGKLEPFAWLTWESLWMPTKRKVPRARASFRNCAWPTWNMSKEPQTYTTLSSGPGCRPLANSVMRLVLASSCTGAAVRTVDDSCRSNPSAVADALLSMTFWIPPMESLSLATSAGDMLYFAATASTSASSPATGPAPVGASWSPPGPSGTPEQCWITWSEETRTPLGCSAGTASAVCWWRESVRRRPIRSVVETPSVRLMILSFPASRMPS